MSSLQLLDMAEGMTRIDPIRTYPSRAAALVARQIGAEGFMLELRDGRTVQEPEGISLPEESDPRRVTLMLRHGRQTLGELHLLLPADAAKVDAHDMRTARWAARAMARCLSYAARMVHEPTRSTTGEVAQTLAKAPLTPRERDVVALLLAGASTRHIASQTQLTVGTVHTYLKRIYPKLGVRSRVELVARMAGTEGMNPQELQSPLS